MWGFEVEIIGTHVSSFYETRRHGRLLCASMEKEVEISNIASNSKNA